MECRAGWENVWHFFKNGPGSSRRPICARRGPASHSANFIFPGGFSWPPPFWPPLPGRRRAPPEMELFLKKGGPLFSWLHRKIKKILFSGGPRKWDPLFQKKAFPFFHFLGTPQKIFFIFPGRPRLTGKLSWQAGRPKSWPAEMLARQKMPKGGFSLLPPFRHFRRREIEPAGEKPVRNRAGRREAGEKWSRPARSRREAGEKASRPARSR